MNVNRQRHAAFRVYAQTPGQRNRAKEAQQRAKGPGAAQEAKRRLPERGYFAEVDPTVPVRSPMAFVEQPDFTKRSGRFHSDLVWNTDWGAQLDREEAERQRRKEYKIRAPPDAVGGLGLARKLDLNSMDVDLSQQLKRRKVGLAERVASIDPTFDPLAPQRKPTVYKPTQADSRRWERGGKFSTRAVAIPLTGEEQILADKAAAEAAEYERLKAELQLWTFGLSVFGVGSIWLAYSRETAISYGVGALGSFVYLRMLNRSVDAFGAEGGGIGAALGQPRLLVPMILTLGYNRWNVLKAAETGLTLELLPMLLGFFTYKAAVATKQASVLLGDLAKSTAGQQTSTD